MLNNFFRILKINKGYFEYCTQFDESSHGPREHNLCFSYVYAGGQSLTISIEAKGNETYDKFIVEQTKKLKEKL